MIKRVLVIEDNNSKKYEVSVRALEKYEITDVTNINNFIQVYKEICNRHIINYDLIILNLCVWPNIRLIGENNMPTTESGAKVLYNLLKENYKIPVIIFSHEKDYLNLLKDFMFPNYSDYCKQFDTSSVEEEDIFRLYEDEIKENKRLLSKLDFVFGHAHNEIELDLLVKKLIFQN